MEIVVADKFRYPISAGGVVNKKGQPELKRKGLKIPRSTVKKAEETVDQNGVFYKIDQEATKEYHKASKKFNEAAAKKKEIKLALAANTIKQAADVSLQNLGAAKTDPDITDGIGTDAKTDDILNQGGSQQ